MGIADFGNTQINHLENKICLSSSPVNGPETNKGKKTRPAKNSNAQRFKITTKLQKSCFRHNKKEIKAQLSLKKSQNREEYIKKLVQQAAEPLNSQMMLDSILGNNSSQKAKISRAASLRSLNGVDLLKTGKIKKARKIQTVNNKRISLPAIKPIINLGKRSQIESSIENTKPRKVLRAVFSPEVKKIEQKRLEKALIENKQLKNRKSSLAYQPNFRIKTKKSLKSNKSFLPNKIVNNGQITQDHNKKEKKSNLTTALNALNLPTEKEKFLNDKLYCPQFVYPINSPSIPFQNPDTVYEQKALKILKMVNDQFGSCENYINSFGEDVSVSEFQKEFDRYVAENNMKGKVFLKIMPHYLAAPFFKPRENEYARDQVIIGNSLNYPKDRILALLEHELGIHFLRNFNERLQPWHRKRKRFDLGEYMTVEEGLGAIVELINEIKLGKRPPFMYYSALYYYAACRAKFLSFSTLYAEIRPYCESDLKCFGICYRSKRGMEDTSQPGCMARDQMYFLGMMKILEKKSQIDFTVLMSGRVDIKDIANLNQVVKREKVKMIESMLNNNYFEDCLSKIIEANKLDF